MRWFRPVVAVLALVLAVGYAADQQWWRVALYVVVAVWFGAATVLTFRGGGPEAVRAEASRAAAEQWPPARVRATLDEVDGDELRAVREVRRASPALSLLDATRLVRAETEQPR